MSYSVPVSFVHAGVPRRRRSPPDDEEADTDADMMMAEQEMKCEAGVTLSW